MSFNFSNCFPRCSIPCSIQMELFVDYVNREVNCCRCRRKWFVFLPAEPPCVWIVIDLRLNFFALLPRISWPVSSPFCLAIFFNVWKWCYNMTKLIPSLTYLSLVHTNLEECGLSEAYLQNWIRFLRKLDSNRRLLGQEREITNISTLTEHVSMTPTSGRYQLNILLNLFSDLGLVHKI